MSRLPALNARDVARALEKSGMILVRTSGSHQIYVDPSDPRRRTVVPLHAGRSLPRGTLHAIIGQAGLTIEEFLRLL